MFVWELSWQRVQWFGLAFAYTTQDFKLLKMEFNNISAKTDLHNLRAVFCIWEDSGLHPCIINCEENPAGKAIIFISVTAFEVVSVFLCVICMECGELTRDDVFSLFVFVLHVRNT